MADPKYKRILLKLSGEALGGKDAANRERSIDPDVIGRIADEIASAQRLGIQVAVVVGGGNIFRGVQGSAWGMDKAAADYVGMLATIMNALMLQEVLKSKGAQVRVQTAITMPAVAEPFIRLRAIRHLEKGRIVIFGGGTGNPLVTTDTAAALRAAEIKASVLLMAKNGVNGIYEDDPRVNPSAAKIQCISFGELITRQLGVMDPAAVSLCKENNVPIVVFDFAEPGSIERIVFGETIGTLVSAACVGGKV
jgi:uridylate kinase